MGGRGWWGALAVPAAAIKTGAGEEMRDVAACFPNLQPLTANSAQRASAFAFLKQRAMNGPRTPPHLVTLILSSPKRKQNVAQLPCSPHPTPGNARLLPLQAPKKWRVGWNTGFTYGLGRTSLSLSPRNWGGWETDWFLSCCPGRANVNIHGHPTLVSSPPEGDACPF